MESFREFLTYLEDKKDLVRIKEEANPIYGVGIWESKYNGKEAIYLENVVGYSIPIVAGIFSKRENIATALGCECEKITNKILDSVRHPGSTTIVKESPVQEIVIQQDINLLRDLPIPKHYEDDDGRYITSGVILAKDPERGTRNLSFARMEVREKDKINIMINADRHLLRYFEKAEIKGESIDVAIIFGAHPAIWLEGAMPDGLVPDDMDEMNIASAMMGKELEVIQGKTIDLAYPANAEIVIEGKILPKLREYEGPFGDYAGIYDQPPRKNPVIEVTCIARRKDAIYHDLLPYTYEHFNLGGIPRETDLLSRIRTSVPGITNIYLTPGGCSRFHAVVQMKKKRESDPMHAVIATLFPIESSKDIKLVVVVDEDINVYDSFDVEWAIATRVQWDKDIFIIPKMEGLLDPSAISSTPKTLLDRDEILSSKIGIDATIPFDKPEWCELYKRVGFPQKNIKEGYRK